MANRNFYKGLNTLVPELTIITGNAVIGAAGAVGTIKGSGVKTVAHGGTGLYTIVLEDKYMRYEGGSSGFVHSNTGAGGSGIMHVEVCDYSVNVHVADGTGIQLACYDKAGALADPASGSVLGFITWLRNSTIKDKGE